MSYTVHCTLTTYASTSFYAFPMGCRVSGGSLTRRSTLVAIPFADGKKETSDGKLDGGGVTVSGRLWASTGDAAKTLVNTMEAALLGHSGSFYVVQYYGVGVGDNFYPVHCCKSVSHTAVEGTAGLWIDVECVFSRGPDPAMV